MSTKEVDRSLVLQNVISKIINLKKGAQLLGISYPQAKRLLSKFKAHGPQGLISKRRGKKSNRAIPEIIRLEIVKIIRTFYYGCKPLFISEKLKERHNIAYSSEFIRKLMIHHQLWFPNQSKKKAHQRRDRRESEGELVQMDASKHRWFEERNSQCHLHLLVDDATSSIYGGYFTPEETTEGYFRACFSYFLQKGLPLNFYNDKRGTFIVNQGKERGETQFARAMRELNVKMIFAHSPEAKGRIERVFGTLQERLVWEMRIDGISTIEDANMFLPKYIERYNKQFAVEPASSFNAHRPLNQNQDLKYTLCEKEVRTVSKNLEVQYNSQIYQLIVDKNIQLRIKNAKIDVITTLDGELHFQFFGKEILYKTFNNQPFKSPDYDSAILVKNWKTPLSKKPSKQHPWRGSKLLVGV